MEQAARVRDELEAMNAEWQRNPRQYRELDARNLRPDPFDKRKPPVDLSQTTPLPLVAPQDNFARPQADVPQFVGSPADDLGKIGWELGQRLGLGPKGVKFFTQQARALGKKGIEELAKQVGQRLTERPSQSPRRGGAGIPSPNENLSIQSKPNGLEFKLQGRTVIVPHVVVEEILKKKWEFNTPTIEDMMRYFR